MIQRKHPDAPLPPPNAAHPTYITVTEGMSGHFAVMMWWNPDMGGFYEPYDTATERHTFPSGAKEDAIAWAAQEKLEFKS